MMTVTPSRIPPKPERCELCGRVMAALTRHHLIPRARHRKKRNQRLLSALMSEPAFYGFAAPAMIVFTRC